MKHYFNTKREAEAACKERNAITNCNGVYKISYGRHKGQYFVGSHLEYLNIY